MIEKAMAEMFEFFDAMFDKYGFDYPSYERTSWRAAAAFGNYVKSMHKLYKEDVSLKKTIIVDYIAGMTDDYALETLKDIFLPNAIKFTI